MALYLSLFAAIQFSFVCIVLTIAFIVCYGIGWIIRKKSWKSKLRHMKIQEHLPRLQKRAYLFGIDTLFRDIIDLRHSNSSRRALRRHQVLGRTYVSTILGRSTIHTIEPAHIRTITTHKFADYEKDDWAQIIAKYMGNGVLVNSGEAWHASRTMLKPLFRRNKTADTKMFAGHIDRFEQYLDRYNGVYIDFRKATQMLVLDITTEFLGARPTTALPHALLTGEAGDVSRPENSLLDLIDGIEPYGNIAIELGPLSLPVFVWHYRRIMKLVSGLQSFFRNAVYDVARQLDQEDQSGTSSSSIIGQMLKQDVAIPDVQGELQNIFFAAFDTTTALLTNVFDCLARYPSVYARLKMDIEATIERQQKPLDECDMSQSLYLRATMMEALRLYSPITYHIRKAQVETTLPNADGSSIHVSKGTSVVWSTYSLNRQPEVCGSDDGETFRPERWLEFNAQTNRMRLIHREDFLPFGSGPRNCLGQQFAQHLTTYVIGRVVLEFDSLDHATSDLPFQEAAAVTCYNKSGTRVQFLLDDSVDIGSIEQ